MSERIFRSAIGTFGNPTRERGTDSRESRLKSLTHDLGFLFRPAASAFSFTAILLAISPAGPATRTKPIRINASFATRRIRRFSAVSLQSSPRFHEVCVEEISRTPRKRCNHSAQGDRMPRLITGYISPLKSRDASSRRDRCQRGGHGQLRA